MSNGQQEIIPKAKSDLENLYNSHKDEGLLAIYIWGSVTRSDFDPSTSDIDVVCIVDDGFEKDNNQKLKAELTEKSPDREWGFQIIYLDELNGGVIRSRLAQAMSPQSILPSFSSWIYVCGKQYRRSDFSVKNATIQERMTLNIKEIRTRLGNIPSDDDHRKIRDRKGVIKACLQLIYNRQLLRNDYFDLDYNVLPKKADNFERPVLDKLLHIKNDSLYGETEYESYIETIKGLADQVEKEISQ